MNTISKDQIRPTSAALLQEKDKDGTPVSVAEISRRSGVYDTTAPAWVHPVFDLRRAIEPDNRPPLRSR